MRKIYEVEGEGAVSIHAVQFDDRDTNFEDQPRSDSHIIVDSETLYETVEANS